MRTIFLLCLLLFSLRAFSQDSSGKTMEGTIRIKKTTSPESPELNDSVYSSAAIAPQFKGGTRGFIRYIRKNLKTPVEAMELDTDAVTVGVTFVIEKDGSVKNIAVTSGVCMELDNEAMRFVKKMPKWKPAQRDGKPVAFRYKMGVLFLINPNALTRQD
jgi:protein TonB